MILTESRDLYEAMMKTLREEYRIDQVRPGLHVTNLIYCLSKSWWDEHDPQPPSDNAAVMFAIGFGLERVLISRSHVEPIEVDGITLSPDFALLGMPGDLKSTRMAPTSSAGCAECGEPYTGHSKRNNGHAYVKGEPIPFELPEGWKRQFMAYRYALNRVLISWDNGSEGSTQWRVTAFQSGELDGTPKTRFGVVVVHLVSAEVKAYEARFSQQELQDNWSWLLQRKATLEAMTGPEPFQHRLYEEECTNCAYLLLCQLQGSMDALEKESACV